MPASPNIAGSKRVPFLMWQALKGALRTFDRGYKSSNLALMVELLAVTRLRSELCRSRIVESDGSVASVLC